MVTTYTATQIINRLQAEITAGRPLFVPNCGFGLSARLQERGGADLICISGTSRWRMKGQGSLAALMPNSDVNEAIFEMAPEIIANVTNTPVISLSAAFNPLLPHQEHLERLRAAGISGINPFMIKIYGDALVAQLDAIGMGWKREVDMVATAAGMGIFALAYAFTADEAREMAANGAHAIASHFGATIGGASGAITSLTLDEATSRSQEIFEAARVENPDIILLSHGGPIEGPDEVRHILANTLAQGFIGGSAAERIPIEKAILSATQQYKSIPL